MKLPWLVKIHHTVKKFTLFDYLIIASIIFSIIFLLIFFVRNERWVQVELKISRPEQRWGGDSPPYWIADSIHKGFAQYDFAGRKIAEIIDIRSWGSETKETWLVLNLKATVNKNQRILKFLYQSVAVGSNLDLEVNGVKIQGVITRIDGLPDQREKKKRTILFRLVDRNSTFLETLGVQPWKAEAISRGDTMRDTQGNVLAEILEVTVKPAEKTVITASGEVLVREDPRMKDVYIKATISTVISANAEYFLDDWLIKIDNELPLILPKINIYPKIISILE